MNKIIKTTLSLLLSLIMLVLCACAPVSAPLESAPAASAAPAATEEPKTIEIPASTIEIVLAAPRDLAPGELDGYYTAYVLQVWEPLINQGDDGGPAPGLAESWTMSQDGKEWTFALRQGVKFHDGEPFNADAVLANIERYKKGPKESPFYSLDINNSFPGLVSAEKVDDYTVKFVFENPSPMLPYTLTNYGSPIFSPKNFNKTGDFNGLPMGTGPFKLVDHKKDEYALLERNEDYYGEKAKAKTIRIRVIPDPDTRFSALKSEEIMGVLDLGAIQPVLASELIKDEKFAVSSAPSTITQYITPNGNKFPFNDVRMREAVSLIIDRQMIVDEFYKGFGTPTVNILNGTSPFYKQIDVPHDIEKAKALAKEVLGDKRVNINVLLWSIMIERYPHKEEAELIQSWLAELGLDAKIQILEGATFKEALKKGEHDLALNIQGLPSAEPKAMLINYMTDKGWANNDYNLAYHSDEVEALVKTLDTEIDIAKRKEIYNKLQDLSAVEHPNIPLFHDATLVAYNKKLTGYDARISGITMSNVAWAD